MTYKFVQEVEGSLQTGIGTEGSLLIEKKIYDELLGEVNKALIPRSEAARYVAPAGVPGSSLDVDLVTPDTLKIRVIGEGSEVSLTSPNFTSTNIKPKKYGARITITREMQEDSKWDLLAESVRIAGKRLAENETNLIITALDGVSGSVSGGAAVTIANITQAMNDVEDSDYQPSTMLVGNEVVNDLRNIDTFTEVDKMGNREMLSSGFIGSCYGMRIYRFSRNAAPSTTYSKYAYVFDRSWCYMIVEKRPIKVENYDLVTHDMSGAVVTQRIAVALLRAAAGSKITSS